MNFAPNPQRLFIRTVHRMDVRPHVVINAAMSVDGKIALSGGKPVRLSNEEDLRRVHALRAKADAVLLGSRRTVIGLYLRRRLGDELQAFDSLEDLGVLPAPTVVGSPAGTPADDAVPLRLDRAAPRGDCVRLEYAVGRRRAS